MPRTRRPVKTRTPVTYRTRGDREWANGVVAGFHDTLKGMFVVVKDSLTGVRHKVRPVNVIPLAV